MEKTILVDTSIQYFRNMQAYEVYQYCAAGARSHARWLESRGQYDDAQAYRARAIRYDAMVRLEKLGTLDEVVS